MLIYLAKKIMHNLYIFKDAKKVFNSLDSTHSEYLNTLKQIASENVFGGNYQSVV